MDLSRAGLLVVDVQKGFDDPVWGPRNNPQAEANIARIVAAWRDAGRPVLHVLHDSTSPASPLPPGTAGNLPKAEAQPRDGEGVYRKSVNSAFIGTSLEADLRHAGIDTLVVVGLTTNHCVSTTVRMAGNFGFDTYLVTDATATFDRAGIDGHNRPAAEVHAAALSDLKDEFATLIDTQHVLKSGGEPA
ncbi:MAG: cysteine hydrolase [Pseudomonadota bacterium]|nr:cysteine hydrolase [Pseudomonadota bacterium]